MTEHTYSWNKCFIIYRTNAANNGAACRNTSQVFKLRGVLFIVRAGSDIIKVDFMHTKRTTFPTKMKIGIHLEKLN